MRNLITIRAWHGTLPEKSGERGCLDRIATVLTEGYEWEFEGTLEEFIPQWNDKFLAFPNLTRAESNPALWNVYVTQHRKFDNR
jgi:hypothetical protein